MSTKSTIVCGENFHLYSEMMDDENVYLELEGVTFEAYRDSVTVAIPAAIWQSIRRHKVDMSYLAHTDEEIRTAATLHVDDERQKYQGHLSACKHCARRATDGQLSACRMLYGVDDPRDERIEEFVRYRLLARERQRAIRDAMAQHRAGGLHLINIADGTTQRVSTVELES